MAVPKGLSSPAGHVTSTPVRLQTPTPPVMRHIDREQSANSHEMAAADEISALTLFWRDRVLPGCFDRR